MTVRELLSAAQAAIFRGDYNTAVIQLTAALIAIESETDRQAIALAALVIDREEVTNDGNSG